MEICVVGTGYVGLVVGTCLADLGFKITCVDKDRAKIEGLCAGHLPIYEPGLTPILQRNVREGRLFFTMDGEAAISDANVVFIAVGTPGLENGSADISSVLAVAEMIGKHLSQRAVVVIKSTVPVGTADKVREAVARHSRYEFDVVSNPEFLKEGAAIKDFTHPDRIVVGCSTDFAQETMRKLYSSLVRTGRPIFFMDNRSAELTKYAANAMLATKISFMNELSRLCERLDADIESVRQGIGTDTRIGPRFLFAGAGYGGSCFPKDVNALIQTGRQVDLELGIAEAVVAANERQKHIMADKIIAWFGDEMEGKNISVWGLAFKPGTDDVREAPAFVVIERLLKLGARVRVYDPEAMETGKRELGSRVSYASSALDAAEGADALLVITEWSEFRNPDLLDLRERMGSPVIFDGRNIYDPETIRDAGFVYEGIGRGRSGAR
jgi:UDPglucose 6-dehydrogenase